MLQHTPAATLWSLALLASSLFLALAVSVQVVAFYASAYMSAPDEVETFRHAIACSAQENESYDRDVARVRRLDDKIRLGRLLREIYKGSDDLRHDLDRLLVVGGAGDGGDGGGSTLRARARILWAGHRGGLQERLRRLDMLRMRFLVVHMGILTTTASSERNDDERRSERKLATETDQATAFEEDLPPPSAAVRKTRSDEVRKRPPLPPPLKTAQADRGHSQPPQGPHRVGWLGVVQELQKSPLMKKRHASIETAMRSPPASPLLSPLGSPLSRPTPATPRGRDISLRLMSSPTPRMRDLDRLRDLDGSHA